MATEKLSPVEEFLNDYRFINHKLLFQDYAAFLLEASDAYELPVPLQRIRETFHLKRHEAAINHRGFLLNNNIFINSDDSNSVQRFTEAHELMEILVRSLNSGNEHQIQNQAKKEQLCEFGAAELLMPTYLATPIISEFGFGLTGATQLANRCQTSLTATMRRILFLDYAPQVFAILKEGYRKSQYDPSTVGQGVLWGEPDDWKPVVELRVWKRWCSPQTKQLLCINESFAKGTLASNLLISGIPGVIESKCDTLDLEYINGAYLVEGMRVTINEMPCVMLLIHL